MNDDMNEDKVETVDTEADTEFEAEEEITVPKRAKFGRVLVLGGFVLSVVLGGMLGIVGSKILAGPDKTTALRAELQQTLDDLRQATQTQTKDLGTTNGMQKQAKARLDTLQAENQILANQIQIMEQSIVQLQNEAKAASKIFTDRITVLEALSGENADVFTGADSIASRLDVLEESALAAIANGVSTKLPEEKPAEETSDIKRIPAKPPVDQTAQATLDTLIDTFPRERLLAAVKAQEKTASKKAGWLKRTLSRHIRVGNDNAPDPYALIDTAEAALKNGQITAALEQLAKLNPPVRTSAAGWVKTAKKAAPNIE